MESNLTTVVVRPGEADRILAGHPWIYQGAIQKLVTPPADGELVQVKDHRHRFLGTGFYNSRSKIAVRLLEKQRVEIDLEYFTQKISEALKLRQKYLPKATSFRVVNAESDFLSGLIVDKYEDVLVFQISSLGMEQRKELIVQALKNIFKPSAIVERNDIGSRKFEGLPEVKQVIHGAVNGPVEVNLNGIKLGVDLLEGHKTGYYLDQQLNYQDVARFAANGRVLDCFCFLGGFSLHAGRGGASQVHGLDQSEDAIKIATANAKLNGLEDKCSFETVNVFDWLKAQTTVGPNEKLIPKFDLIILDPPSFTRNRESVPDALRGYKEIHLRALKLLKPGGVLATFCCSHHVDAVTFQQVILDAAFDAHRILRKVATYGQSPDHPVLPSIPETEYLKGYAFEVAR
ncbi:MAG: class I SAM-dependent rRNA methyltransferase [Verrucomicrobiales bacterium]